MRRLIYLLALILIFSSFLAIVAQEQKPEEPAKTAPMGFGARMKTAKTVFLRDGGGNPIAFNVISSAFEGWGRYLPVNKPEDADLIVEVSGPDGSGGSGISVSSSTTPSGLSGSHNEAKTTTSKESSNGPIKMVVYDGKSKAAMWSATEKPKSGMRKKTQEDNMVEAAERLFTMFHDGIEPPPPPVK